MRNFLLAVAGLASLLLAARAAQADIAVQKRSRVQAASGQWVVKEAAETWQPSQTAIIVCDMWDSHHCLNAVRRAVEMAPRMNDVLMTARGRGVLIIHAPSSCMEAYQDRPGRHLAQAAAAAKNLPAEIGKWCYVIPAEEQGTYPIDQKDGGEDDDAAEHQLWQDKLAALGRNPKSPWKNQLALLTIDDKDAISDSGVEIWNLLEARGIKNVILLGVHTNMCVLGRPFGLRRMAENGKNVVLMRDMTDTMYDPAKWPYVSHFAGTDLIVEHIEKYVCPTITSVDLLAAPQTDSPVPRVSNGLARSERPTLTAFRFARDKRKVVMLIGDDEYKTEVSLPAFVKSDLEPLGFDVQIIHADSQDKNLFPGMAEGIRNADLVLVSVRRRLPPQADLDALRAHVAAGKPLVGIRTACHAWCLRNEKDNQAAAAKGQASWPEFDPEVFGGHYTNHYGNGPQTAVSVAEGARDHAILRGVALDKLVGIGSLYKVLPLTETTTPLLMGTIAGQASEPIAWTNLAGPNKARVFNTTLGHEGDFANSVFRKLLVNALFWALEQPYPRGQDVERLLPQGVK